MLVRKNNGFNSNEPFPNVAGVSEHGAPALSSVGFVFDKELCDAWGIVQLAEKMWFSASDQLKIVINRQSVRKHLVVCRNRTNHCLLGMGCDCILEVNGICNRFHEFSFQGVCRSVVPQSKQLQCALETYVQERDEISGLPKGQCEVQGIPQVSVDISHVPDALNELIHCSCPKECIVPGTEYNTVHVLNCPIQKVFDMRKEASNKAKEKAEQFMSKYITVFENVLTLVGPVCTYVQDVHGKWVYSTNQEGYTNLRSLTSFVSARMFSRIQGKVDRLDEVQRDMDHALSIYEGKPSNYVDGTWSSLEYANPSFQAVYMRYKCLQRYTEVYNMMHRAYDQGHLAWMCGRQSVSFVSYGCGPAFELHAIRDFMSKYYPDVTFHGTGIDLEPSWIDVVTRAGFEFVHGDFSIIVPRKEVVDFLVLSGVLHSYLRGVLCSRVDHWFESYTSLSGILVNDRPKSIRSYRALSSVYVVTRLVSLSDDRQVYIFKHGNNDRSRYFTRPSLPLLYPNVPYVEDVEGLVEYAPNVF